MWFIMMSNIIMMSWILILLLSELIDIFDNDDFSAISYFSNFLEFIFMWRAYSITYIEPLRLYFLFGNGIQYSGIFIPAISMLSLKCLLLLCSLFPKHLLFCEVGSELHFPFLGNLLYNVKK